MRGHDRLDAWAGQRAHPDQTTATAAGVTEIVLPGPALVRHLDLQGQGLVGEPDPGPRASGMLERVGQGLLDDAVGSQLDAGIQGP